VGIGWNGVSSNASNRPDERLVYPVSHAKAAQLEPEQALAEVESVFKSLG
jgi:hypothetical protein